MKLAARSSLLLAAFKRSCSPVDENYGHILLKAFRKLQSLFVIIISPVASIIETCRTLSLSLKFCSLFSDDKIFSYLGRKYEERLKRNALAICGEADAFRGGTIQEAELQISASTTSGEDRGGLLEGSHHRENLIEFYNSKKQRGNVTYKKIFEVLKQRVEEIRYKGETAEARDVFRRRLSNMAVIVGEPGIGKSSLAKRMVREMLAEEDPLFNPDVVFFIRFRYVDYEKDTDLLQFLDPTAEATYPKREDRIKILEILEELDNVYVIMDGLDEANIELKLNPSKFSSIHSVKKAADFIEDMWNGNILPKSKKLLTSRPYAISKQPKVLFTIQGLTEEGLKRICSDICDDDKGRCKIILNYLENHLDLKSYCFTPVICIMTMKSLNKSNLVFELSNVEASGENPTIPSSTESMTAIFVGALKDWLYEEKDRRKFKLRKLSLFAFSNFERRRYFFRDYELKEAEIETQNISNFFFKGGEILYFVHLMWQEFLVAVHFRLYTKKLEPNNIEKLNDKSYEMVSRFLFGLCNEQTLGMLLDCVEIEEGRNYAADREKFKQELKQLAMSKLRRRQDIQDQSFHSFLPTLKWVREMGDPLFTTKAIEEAAACLGDKIEIAGNSSSILPTDVLDIIKVLNARDAELALVFDNPTFVGNSCQVFFEKLLTTFAEKRNIHVSALSNLIIYFENNTLVRIGC